MSKVNDALKKVQKQRNRNKRAASPSQTPVIKSADFRISDKGMMRNSWLVWVFIVGVVVTILVAFNYQGGSNVAPLSEIFPEEEAYPVDIEYEFIEQDGQAAKAQIKDVKEPQVVKKKVEKVVAPKEVKKEVAQPVVAKKPAPKVVEKKVETPKVVAAPKKVVPAQKKVVTQSPILTAADLKSIPYTIQVASFKTKARANKALADLKQKDLSAYIVSRNLGDKGTWYRIYVGKFKTKSEAQTTLVSVRKHYKDSFVISPKK